MNLSWNAEWKHVYTWILIPSDNGLYFRKFDSLSSVDLISMLMLKFAMVLSKKETKPRCWNLRKLCRNSQNVSRILCASPDSFNFQIKLSTKLQPSRFVQKQTRKYDLFLDIYMALPAVATSWKHDARIRSDDFYSPFPVLLCQSRFTILFSWSPTRWWVCFFFRTQGTQCSFRECRKQISAGIFEGVGCNAVTEMTCQKTDFVWAQYGFKFFILTFLLRFHFLRRAALQGRANASWSPRQIRMSRRDWKDNAPLIYVHAEPCSDKKWTITFDNISRRNTQLYFYHFHFPEFILMIHGLSEQFYCHIPNCRCRWWQLQCANQNSYSH